jgi:predicted metal-dependent enzyme (double-stranded beta helix superfamily)
MGKLLETFCGELRCLFETSSAMEEAMVQVRQLLGRFAVKPVFLRDVLSRQVAGDNVGSVMYTPDTNEVTLFRDPDGLFSLRLYVWDPAVSYPIHSHGSWGIVSCVAGAIQERKFQRLDDGARPGYARLKESARSVLKHGEITTILPLDQGIHQMDGVVQEHASVSLHLYGKPVRRGFLEFFNPHKDSVYRVTYPGLNNRLYALQALGAIREDWTAEILEQAAGDKSPLIRYEALKALAGVQKEKAMEMIKKEASKENSLRESFKSLFDSCE